MTLPLPARPALRLCAPVLALCAAGACVDICVLSGAPCDSHADCEQGLVCRLRRGSEPGCLFAAGTCVEGSCGSVADCGEGQCCHPDSNDCVEAEHYEGACGPRTCSDCPECTLGFCETRGGLARCSSDDQCPDDHLCVLEKCRPVCSYDSDCPGARCADGTCSEPYGAPCEDYDGCAGLSCYEQTPAGATRPGYCSYSCQQSSDCPLGHYFVCVGGRCLMP